jgi:PKD repeat protein
LSFRPKSIKGEISVKKQRSILFVLFALVLTLTSFWSAGAPLAAEAPPADPPPGEGPWVVRAYFTDRAMVDELAAWREPWEVHYDDPSAPSSGYLVVDVDREGYERLLAIGFRLEVDERLTKQLTREPAILPGQTMGIPGYPCYRTVEETYATAQAIATAHPDLATWIDVGDSWEKVTPGGAPGYDMMVLRLTNANVPGPKPKLFVMTAIHAREYTTAELNTRYAEYLVDNYGIDPDVTWLLDYHEIHLMLQSNPDGRKKAETGLLWRKNTNENYCGATSNDRGADLNRNYPFQWGCCGGSSGNPCSETYRGPSPASEPETQVVLDYIRSEFPDQRPDDLVTPAPDDAMGIFLDIHSYSQLVIWPWGFTYTTPPNSAGLQTLGRKLAFFNGYEPDQAIGLYTTDGTTDDTAYGELGVAAYTFELGTSFFQDCSTFENIILPDNLPALLYAAKAARTPYMTPAGPDALAVTANPAGATAGDPVHLSATIDDTRYNNQNGSEPTQSIAAAEYYVDVPPWVTTTTPISYPMSAVDGAFNETIEDVEATLDTTGLSSGRHTIFVRAQDAAGNWGVVSAAFLYILEPGVSPVIEGYVRDGVTNAPVAANVQAAPFQADSDPVTGYYSMTVVSGTYDMVATAPLYAASEVEGVGASDGQVVRQDFYLVPICAVFEDDVESGNNGWSATGQWAITTESSHSPSHSWTDSPGSNYGNNWNYSITSPLIDLTDYSGTELAFWHAHDLEDGYDYGYLEYSTDGGISWVTAGAYNGESNPPVWCEETLPLPDLDDQANVRLRFRIDSDGWITGDGWWIDDVELRAGGLGCTTPLAPTPAFSSTSPVMFGEPVTFTNHTLGTPPFDFHWDFGDGMGTSTESDPAYLYTSGGTFAVTLVATNAVGTGTFTDQVVVIDGPCTPVTDVNLSMVGAGPVAPGQAVEFSLDAAPAGASPPYSYTVDFYDGTAPLSGTFTSRPLAFTHTFTAAGSYTVTGKVWNCDMEPAQAVSDTVAVSVGEACAGVVTATLSLSDTQPLYVNQPVNLRVDLEPANATPPISYTVAFGDQTAPVSGSAEDVPFTLQHTYTQPATYTVDLDVWNCGLTQPVTASLDLVVLPVYHTYLPVVLK